MHKHKESLFSEADFASLGADKIAYARPFMKGNKKHFLLIAGDGRQLGVAPNYQTAIAAALENNFEPVSLH